MHNFIYTYSKLYYMKDVKQISVIRVYKLPRLFCKAVQSNET